MNKKQILIEFLPRILWIIEGFCLYLGVRYYSFTFSIKTLTVILAYMLIVIGAVFLLWVFSIFIIKAKTLITKELIASGPYKIVRHPMYTAIYIILVGVGLLLSSYTWFIILVFFIPFWYLVARAEEWQMTSLYGEKYLAYKKKTRMFL
jgi:protein-S-isoprenylcysteine O-methyltransferase Ste14